MNLKKIVKVFVLLCVFITNAYSNKIRVKASEDNNGEIVSTENFKVYYDAETGEVFNEQEKQINSNSTRELHPISITITYMRYSNHTVGFRISLEGDSVNCMIKGVSGTYTAKDTSTYGQTSSSFTRSQTIPYRLFNCECNIPHVFTVGHTVKITVSFRINLVNGDVLNGNYSTHSGYVVVK